MEGRLEEDNKMMLWVIDSPSERLSFHAVAYAWHSQPATALRSQPRAYKPQANGFFSLIRDKILTNPPPTFYQYNDILAIFPPFYARPLKKQTKQQIYH